MSVTHVQTHFHTLSQGQLKEPNIRIADFTVASERKRQEKRQQNLIFP